MKYVETKWHPWQRFLKHDVKLVPTKEAIQLAKLEYDIACNACTDSGASDGPGSGQCLATETDRLEIKRLCQILNRGFTTIDLSETTW